MYHMVFKYPKSPWNITDGHKNIWTFSNLRHSKIYPNRDFWFENKLFGNPIQVVNSTIRTYNTSVVKIYNATSSLVRLENTQKNFYF
jgi:hypothetical protein